MLVLTRKHGERITIGPDVELEIVEISRGRVRLGITAPKDQEIRRKPPRVCGRCACPAESDPCGLCAEDIQRLRMQG